MTPSSYQISAQWETTTWRIEQILWKDMLSTFHYCQVVSFCHLTIYFTTLTFQHFHIENYLKPDFSHIKIRSVTHSTVILVYVKVNGISGYSIGMFDWKQTCWYSRTCIYIAFISQTLGVNDLFFSGGAPFKILKMI